MKRTVVEQAYSIIPEGEGTFKIIDVEVDDNFNTVSVIYANKQGVRHTERYYFEKNDGTPNNIALAIYTGFGAKVLGLNKDDSFEDEELKGKYFKANVKHEENTYTPKTGKYAGTERTVTRIKLSNIRQASGFNTTVSLDDLDD